MGAFHEQLESTNRCVYHNGADYGWGDWAQFDIECPFRIRAVHSSVVIHEGAWKFRTAVAIEARYLIEVSNWGSSVAYVTLKDHNTGTILATGQADFANIPMNQYGGDLVEQCWVECSGVTAPDGSTTRVDVEIHADVSGVPSSCGASGIHHNYMSNNYGHHDLQHIYVGGYFDVSDIPLKPTVKWSEWYHTFDQQYDNISENSIAIRFTVDQPAEEVACIITNLTDILNGSANPRHSGIIYIPKAKLGDHSINGQQAYYFNIRNTDWNGIKYAYKYRVLFGVKNKNGIWNTGGNTWNPNVSPIPVYCSMDAATKNHLPRLVTTGHNNNNIVTGCTFRLEEVLFKGHTDIKVDIISHSCTAGRLINISEEYSHDAAYWDENGDGTDDEVVQILYGAIQPDTEIEFNVTLAATRRLEPVSQYGLHTISFGKSGKTLRPAFISSMNNFFFYDAVKYTLFNESFFGCTVKFIVDLATDYLIWSDTHDRTVAYKNNQEITHNMSQTELDNTYLKWPRDVNEISIRMDVVTVGDYGTYTRSVTVKCKLNGNHLTGHIGIGGIPRRAKCWIGTENGPKRCILWIGVDGKPRRCI